MGARLPADTEQSLQLLTLLPHIMHSRVNTGKRCRDVVIAPTPSSGERLGVYHELTKALVGESGEREYFHPKLVEVLPTEQWRDTRVSGRAGRAFGDNIGHHGVKGNGEKHTISSLSL